MVYEQNKVLVLLAAFNGQQYLAEQLESVLAQKYVSVNIVISLDESDDSSLTICENYSTIYSNISLLPYGEKFGCAGKNFYRLVRDVDFTKYDFVSFCDQDDIWPTDKLSRAIQFLQKYDCYSSNVLAFWDDGREVLIDKVQSQREWDFLFEAAGPGCTYVLRRNVAIAFKAWLIGRYDKINDEIALHDWLIYAFSRNFGFHWFIDAKPMMRYRQHANNQVGTNNNIAAARVRIKLIKNKWYRNQVTKIAEHLGLQEKSIVKYGLKMGYIGNIYMLFHITKLRRRLRDRLALALAFVINLF
ncbi:glycosyltransferase [Aeromonas hydrophila]|uniref:glycosyltransferase n=1 Tax=Aeromonas hydrophila TaxID=644 RepID=UPI0004B30936|nr:glycosyltransferase [Aeromonas hydrophila]MBW3808976.1 glycosyltransferase [Aeromonas hydrophila]